MSFVLLTASGCSSSQDTSEQDSESAQAVQPGDLNTPDAMSSPDIMAPEPRVIHAPSVEPCPYTDEVDAVAFDEKFQRALDLGCEHDVYGDITFTEPIQGPDGEMFGLLSPEHALTMEELHDAGYISDADFEAHLEHRKYMEQQPGN